MAVAPWDGSDIAFSPLFFFSSSPLESPSDFGISLLAKKSQNNCIVQFDTFEGVPNLHRYYGRHRGALLSPLFKMSLLERPSRICVSHTHVLISPPLFLQGLDRRGAGGKEGVNIGGEKNCMALDERCKKRRVLYESGSAQKVQIGEEVAFPTTVVYDDNLSSAHRGL